MCVREFELVLPRDHGCFPYQTQSTGSEEPGVSPAWRGSWSWDKGGQRDLEPVLDSVSDLVYDPLQSLVLSSSSLKAFLSLLSCKDKV